MRVDLRVVMGCALALLACGDSGSGGAGGTGASNAGGAGAAGTGGGGAMQNAGGGGGSAGSGVGGVQDCTGLTCSCECQGVAQDIPVGGLGCEDVEGTPCVDGGGGGGGAAPVWENCVEDCIPGP